MGFRFRRQVKIAPGVKLNVSKSGVSTTIGTQGASLNIGKNGARTTIGAPGTGMSYSTYHSYGKSDSAGNSEAPVTIDATPQKKAGYAFLITLGVLIMLLGLLLHAAEVPSGKYFAIGGVVFIAFSIFITRGRNKMIEEQNKALIAEQEQAIIDDAKRKVALAEELQKELQEAYNQRIALINERVEQKLLTPENRDIFLKHIADRTITIENLDRELKRSHAFYSRINRLTEKYGEEIADKLLAEEYWIGMTKEQLLDAKGREPDKIEIEALKTKTKETLIYGNKNSGDVFVVVDGLVERFKDR